MIEINLAEFIENSSKWIDSLIQSEKSKNTVRSYNNGIQSFINYLKENNITKINKESVISYKNFLLKKQSKQELSVNTINQKIISINRFFKDNSLKELTVRSETIHRSNITDTLTETDYKRLIRWANKLNMEREKLIMQTLANTGIRLSELKYFTVDNLKKAGRTGTIEVYNKGKFRYVIVPDKLKKDLLSYARKNKIKGNELIFHSRTDKYKLLDQSQIWRNLKYIAGKARVKKAITKAHNFRHLYSKRFLEKNGNNILLLKDLLGHSSLQTTELYTRLSGYEAKLIINDLYDSGE